MSSAERPKAIHSKLMLFAVQPHYKRDRTFVAQAQSIVEKTTSQHQCYSVTLSCLQSRVCTWFCRTGSTAAMRPWLIAEQYDGAMIIKSNSCKDAGVVASRISCFANITASYLYMSLQHDATTVYTIGRSYSHCNAEPPSTISTNKTHSKWKPCRVFLAELDQC